MITGVWTLREAKTQHLVEQIIPVSIISHCHQAFLGRGFILIILRYTMVMLIFAMKMGEWLNVLGSMNPFQSQKKIIGQIGYIVKILQSG